MTMDTIFDCASLTKVIATTSSLMKLFEEGKFRLNDKVTDYIPEFQGGKSDITISVRAMKAGAVDFLAKPFRDQDMLDAVVAAIGRDRRRREHEREVSALKGRFESLSPREREIMELVTAGLMNKQIAAELGLSEITVKIHRGNVMKKMVAKSLADLVKMAESLELGPGKR